MASDGSRGSPSFQLQRLMPSGDSVFKKEQTNRPSQARSKRNHPETNTDTSGSETDVKAKDVATRKRFKASQAEATTSARSAVSSSFRVISLDDGTEYLGSAPEPTEEEHAQMDLDLKLFVGADGKAKSGDQVMKLTEQLLTTLKKHILNRTKKKILERRDGKNFHTITMDEADALYTNLDERFSHCDSGMMEEYAEIVQELPIPLLGVQYNDFARYLLVIQHGIVVPTRKDVKKKGCAQERYRFGAASKPPYEEDDEDQEFA